jgi:hypothetical protein
MTLPNRKVSSTLLPLYSKFICDLVVLLPKPSAMVPSSPRAMLPPEVPYKQSLPEAPARPKSKTHSATASAHLFNPLKSSSIPPEAKKLPASRREHLNNYSYDTDTEERPKKFKCISGNDEHVPESSKHLQSYSTSSPMVESSGQIKHTNVSSRKNPLDDYSGYKGRGRYAQGKTVCV